MEPDAVAFCSLSAVTTQPAVRKGGVVVRIRDAHGLPSLGAGPISALIQPKVSEIRPSFASPLQMLWIPLVSGGEGSPGDGRERVYESRLPPQAGLLEGHYVLQLAALSYSFPFTVEGGRTVEVNVATAPAAKLSMTLFEAESGEPFEGRVSVKYLGMDPSAAADLLLQGSYPATFAEGVHEVEGMSGWYEVRAWNPRLLVHAEVIWAEPGENSFAWSLPAATLVEVHLPDFAVDGRILEDALSRGRSEIEFVAGPFTGREAPLEPIGSRAVDGGWVITYRAYYEGQVRVHLCFADLADRPEPFLAELRSGRSFPAMVRLDGEDE